MMRGFLAPTKVCVSVNNGHLLHLVCKAHELGDETYYNTACVSPPPHGHHIYQSCMLSHNLSFRIMHAWMMIKLGPYLQTGADVRASPISDRTKHGNRLHL